MQYERTLWNYLSLQTFLDAPLEQSGYQFKEPLANPVSKRLIAYPSARAPSRANISKEPAYSPEQRSNLQLRYAYYVVYTILYGQYADFKERWTAFRGNSRRGSPRASDAYLTMGVTPSPFIRFIIFLLRPSPFFLSLVISQGARVWYNAMQLTHVLVYQYLTVSPEEQYTTIILIYACMLLESAGISKISCSPVPRATPYPRCCCQPCNFRG